MKTPYLNLGIFKPKNALPADEGSFQVKNDSLPEICAEIIRFLKKRGVVVKKKTWFSFRPPDSQSMVSWHKDLNNGSYNIDFICVWSTEKPTLVRPISDERAIYQAQPYEMVLINNQEAEHASPPNIRTGKRHFIRVYDVDITEELEGKL